MADTSPRLARCDRDPARHVPRSTLARHLGAAALGVLLVLTACGDDDDDDGKTAASTTTTTSAPTTSTTETPPQTTSTTVAAGVQDAAGTARAWVDAIASGDDDSMVELVAPKSLDAFGGEQGVRESEIALSEGWGAWSSADGLEVTGIEITPGLSIAVFHGEVSQEGPPEEAWTALPIVATPDGDRVEPFLSLGEPVVDPPANSDIDSIPVLDVDVADGVQLYVGFDDGPITAVLEGEIRGTEELDPGLHAFVVVQVGDDGAVMARTFLYGVAG